jgi:Ferritin-like domain
MSDVDVMNQGLAGEHFGIAAYAAALASGLLDESVADVAKSFQADHEHHRDLLIEQIERRGGTPVVALEAAAYAKEYPPLASAGDILAYAIELEAGATRGSVLSVDKYEDRELALLAARIGAVEAQHWAVLLGATGANPVPSPLIDPA